MTQIELLADVAQRSLDFVRMTLADFSDADLLVRPAPGANHAAWQLGHMAVSEHRLVGMSPKGQMPPLPAGFAERFSRGTTGVDDPALLATKVELLEAFAQMRAASVAWILSLSVEDLALPGPEPLRARVPTVGHLCSMLPTHTAMHIGQIQVIRRKLGKPVLF